MKSRGKKKDAPQEPRSMHETFYEAMSAHLLMMGRAEKRARERLGIEPPKPRQKLIEQKSDGTLLYNGKVVHFKNPGTYPHKVFIAILKNQDIGLGYAPYRKINRWIEADGVETLIDERKIMKRIRNAVDNIFRSSNLPEKIPSGESLIETIDGKGVFLRNPDIN